MAYHTLGHAPQQEAVETRSAMRPQDDDIRSPLSGAIENRAARVSLPKLRAGAELRRLKALRCAPDQVRAQTAGVVM